jgi:putative transposase
MHFEPSHIYHLFNLGNNQKSVFFSKNNYELFLDKIKQEWLPYVDVLAYSLVPTEFHFIIVPGEAACEQMIIQHQPAPLQKFSRIIGCTLSSYAKAINIKHNTSGCLFHKKTRIKELRLALDSPVNKKDVVYCMNLLHAKPVSKGLVKDPHSWEYSSYKEYSTGKPGICQTELLTSPCLLISNVRERKSAELTEMHFALNV